MKKRRMKCLVVATGVAAAVWLATPAWADPFFFSTGIPDGLLGALSQPPIAGGFETETAHHLVFTEITGIAQAIISRIVGREQRQGSISKERSMR